MQPFQSAYREGHSTETALVRVFNDLVLNADANKINILCLLDLSAAFDTIDHGILLTRLEKTFGINGIALVWLQSYLTNHRQTVMVDGVKSANHVLNYGVPQGSVLGPALFTVYMKPLSSIIARFNFSYHFYADDSQIYNSVPLVDFEDLIVRLQSCFREIKDWMNQNRLMLNDDKTEILVCGRPNIVNQLQISSVSLGNNVVHFSKSVKNLGVYFDSHLSMSDQINHLIKCLYINIRRIRKIRHLIPLHIAHLLVNSLVLSKLDYCNALLTNISKENLARLQVVQNDAARLVLKKSRCSQATPLLYQLHWLPVESRITYKICTLVYKSLNDQSPFYIYDLLKCYSPVRNLRSKNDKSVLIKPVTHRKIGEQSFVFSAPTLWNSIPNEVRSLSSISTFKSKLKFHLFNLYYN